MTRGFEVGDRVQILANDNVRLVFIGLIGVVMEVSGENVKLLMDDDDIILNDKSTPNPIWGAQRDVCKVGAIEPSKKIKKHGWRN